MSGSDQDFVKGKTPTTSLQQCPLRTLSGLTLANGCGITERVIMVFQYYHMTEVPILKHPSKIVPRRLTRQC